MNLNTGRQLHRLCVMNSSGIPWITKAESLKETVLIHAPKAKLIHLEAPPVIGGVLLAMELIGVDGYTVRNKLIEAKQKKAAILLISEDLDEIFSLSDWIAPVYEGKFMDIIPAETAKRESVGAMMAGITLAGEEA